MSYLHSSSSSNQSRPIQRSITGVENAQQRLERLHSLSKLYQYGATPFRPKSKTDLDVLKEHHKFIRTTTAPETLSWEEALAEKYYQSLFREFAVVDLKHYKSGAIALRWRTEDEVLDGIGSQTCASLRCEYHQPSSTPSDFQPPEREQQVEEQEIPLVPARLTEQEMHFGYNEEGEKKSALVKVVLCDKCSKKLRKGREKAREMREEEEKQEMKKRLILAAEADEQAERHERDRTHSRSSRRPYEGDERSERKQTRSETGRERGVEEKRSRSSRPHRRPDPR